MLKSEDGIVGFFDVMGYQDIIDNNNIEIVAKIISETIDKLPDESRLIFLKRFEKVAVFGAPAEHIVKSIKTLLISDSIVISLAFNKSVDKEDYIFWKKFYWLFFFIFIAFFLKKAFDEGLLLRGAIDTGSYFIQDYIFAGKPIIESYRLSARLKFSGCALTHNAVRELEELLKDNDPKFKTLFDQPIFPYLAPLSDNDERLYLIDWFVGEVKYLDIRQVIVNAFHKHNKDVPRKVFPLIENTEMIIRHMISRK